MLPIFVSGLSTKHYKPIKRGVFTTQSNIYDRDLHESSNGI